MKVLSSVSVQNSNRFGTLEQNKAVGSPEEGCYRDGSSGKAAMEKAGRLLFGSPRVGGHT